MDEDFHTSRSTYVHLNANKCPYTSGHVRPYFNMRSRTSLDPDTFGSTSVGSTAGSIKDGGTYNALDERSFIKYKTQLRGMDVQTNTGVEMFKNTFHNYPVWQQPGNMSATGQHTPTPMYHRPINHSWSNPMNPVFFT